MKNESLYYTEKNNVDDREYVVDTKDVIKIYGTGFINKVVNTFVFKGKTKTINLGSALRKILLD